MTIQEHFDKLIEAGFTQNQTLAILNVISDIALNVSTATVNSKE